MNRRQWKLIDIDTRKVVCRGHNPYDLIEWYHSNHFDSWYLNGVHRYDMISSSRTNKYFIQNEKRKKILPISR